MKIQFFDNKKIWKHHCEKYYVPLYLQPWWNDLVCGEDNWGVCLSLDAGGNVEGALVFFLKKVYGFTIIEVPPLTTYSGLWFQHPKGDLKPSSKNAFEKRVCFELVNQIPKNFFFYQQWYPDINNWLPFFWKNYKGTIRYTFRSQLPENNTRINRNVKRGIKTADLKVKIIENGKLSTLCDLYIKSISGRGLTPHFSFNLLEKVDEELKRRNQRKLLMAVDENGNCHAAAYFIWDSKITYSTICGTHPEFRESKALTLLFYKALTENYGDSEIFDFEGSMDESVEEFLRSFGGQMTPYFKVFKAQNRIMKIALATLSDNFY